MSLTEKYELESIGISSQTWNAVLQANFQKLDDHLHTRCMGEAGEDLSAYQAIYLQSDGKVGLAQADGTNQPCVGITLESVLADETVRFQVFGTVTNTGWSWANIGQLVYLDPTTAGGLTQTAPGSNIQVVGFAMSATSIFLLSLVGNTEASAHTHTESDITDLDKYTQAEVDAALAGKSDTTHNHNLADLTERDYSSLESPPGDDDMHTLTDETTVAADDEVLIYDASAGAYRRMTRANFISGLAADDQPYIIGGTYNGTHPDGIVLIIHPIPIAVTLPAGLTGSQMIATTAAAGEAVFSLQKNGTEFGTATFAAAGTSATFAAASETIFSAGDVFTIVGPETADAELAGVGWAIVGSR